MRILFAALALLLAPAAEAQPARSAGRESRPATLGLERGFTSFEAAGFRLDLVDASGTAAALAPLGREPFDFTPGSRIADRAADRFHHLGDLTLQWRFADSLAWRSASTADARRPVQPRHSGLAVTGPLPTRPAVADVPPSRPTGLAVTGPPPSRPAAGPPPAISTVLAASDLKPTLPEDLPLRVVRTWSVEGGALALRFDLRNEAERPVEIGALGLPMIFDNVLTGRSLEEAHARNSFHDPYIGLDAGYLQVVRLSGDGPVLLVVPEAGTPFEAWNPLHGEATRRGITFEGFHEWMVHSRAYADAEWRGAEPWNEPSSAVLWPGEGRRYGVRFLLARSVRDVEETLAANGRPVAVGIPGTVLPLDAEGRLFVRAPHGVAAIHVEPAGALFVEPSDPLRAGPPDGLRAEPSDPLRAGLPAEPSDPNAALPADSLRTGAGGAWRAFRVRGRAWGRARMTITYDDSSRQSVHWRVIDPAADVVDALGRFLTTEQWFDRPNDPFGRSPAVISYDGYARRQVTEDARAWIAGLGDEGGSGSWLAAVMKQYVRPDSAQISKLERFMDETLWGGLQIAQGPLAYGVRKSLFYWEPGSMPPGTYSDSVRYGGWASWSREHAMTVGRSFNYVHVAAAWWVFYRLARTTRGLVTGHGWEWYLEQARRTALAMVRLAPDYAQFGQMEGTVFVRILQDLQREGLQADAAELEGVMRGRAEVWRGLPFPFGSEMPWDSTGQEEVYAWCRHFGFDGKADITLRAILAYMPTLAHWGYNGSARRYWDFQYAGHPRYARIERQLHHYGSGLNSLPVLAEFRRRPDDLHLLRVGHAGNMGALANVTREGFGPSAFHAYPASLDIDGYSGDYGPGFLGHALGSGAWVTRSDAFGWIGFGANLRTEGTRIVAVPTDAGRRSLFVAPLRLGVELDAGRISRAEFDPTGDEVTLTLEAGTLHVSEALLRLEGPYAPAGSFAVERGAFLVPLRSEPRTVTLGRLP